MDVFIDGRITIITPKQRGNEMPKKNKDENKFEIAKPAVSAMASEASNQLTDKEAEKANEKRRKKLDKVSRRIQEIKVMMQINDKDKKHYGKKLNKCIKKDSKLQEELDELLKKEQELQ